MQPTLSAQFKDLKADVAFFLGFGRGEDFDEPAWDSRQEASISRCVKGGLRNFYHCGYQWSFLQPVLSLTLASGATTITLPDDYGGKEGEITVTAGSTVQCWPVQFVGVGMIYQRSAQFPDTTGRPLMACEEPLKGTGTNSGQQSQLHVWPIADQEYTLRFQSYVSPDYLTGSHPYAYGGPQHAETLLESCLAVAEKILDDTATVHAAEFEKRLAVSIDMDRRNKPQVFGWNRDRSDYRDRERYGRGRMFDGGITYMGTLY